MKIRSTGFTVIELMITVAILAIVASIAIPLYSGYITSAYRAECSNEVAAMDLAQNEFFLENNTYFDDGAGGITEIEDASGNLYVSGYTVNGDAAATAANIAAAECSYVITPGATGDIATSYQITATGQNNLNGEGCVAQKPTKCP